VRDLITDPRPDEPIARGVLAIRGVAWSGAAPIARVEARVGDDAWQETHLIGDRNHHRWQWWELITRVERRGATRLRARAADLAGRAQPEQPP
jgi:hypothetical protein